MYDPCLPLSLHADASIQYLGVVLYQGKGVERQKLVYSCQKRLAETIYLIMDLEALAVVWAIDNNWHYLFGRPFIVVMDHHLLYYLHQWQATCRFQPGIRGLKTTEMPLSQWHFPAARTVGLVWELPENLRLDSLLWKQYCVMGEVGQAVFTRDGDCKISNLTTNSRLFLKTMY